MKTYHIPLIVTVVATVNDDGTTVFSNPTVDCEGSPWAGSTDPIAWDVATEEWIDDRDIIEDLVMEADVALAKAITNLTL